ncbi:membrane-bound PQQ-dependent dehydrogenase, glucose/quinate/shikimate family [Pantoea sp. Acro-805]|uniref:Membrane-bound PQQ-dependent dehydrogenase, glucose/quinate/shikimate family n=1 Tax=Candidatus Pantoea formicae TaxID=2608355 RepID=A0ABX0QZN7_9GAMM|nr:membrane-bound PQQ-dependent dehydrogenase, glucose/quinate/shikimate family [Pantoea formicae]MDF7649938.1 membrane-bound PQQ-dependent dehydrogenase, glucose/quinate/shikimate family [Erwiniaceae bacterium L1_54_3]NIF02449.1 membrane-bound PQQ-dependent dehydrogenase, glucose/quinate/shikimate family [Pantoea formicae]
MTTDNPGKLGRLWVRLVGIVTTLAGLYFIGGGGWLAWLGGSWYFIIAGILLLLSGVLIVRRKLAGAAMFGVVLVWTAVWSLWEVGLQFWPLFSRLFAPAAGAMLIAFTVPLLTSERKTRRLSVGVGALLAVGVVTAFISSFQPKGIIRNEDVQASSDKAHDIAPNSGRKDWPAWAGDTKGSRFSTLSDITPENVKDLKVAWTAHTGEAVVPDKGDAEDQNTPLQVGDSLFVCTAYTSLISYDIDSGKEKWRYTAGRGNSTYQRCRGIGYFDATSAKNVAEPGQPLDASVSPQRLFFPTGDGRLVAIDAHTGKPAANFGDNGVVDLKVGMGEVKPGYYQQSSAPLVAGNLVIVGGRVIDNFETNEPPGVIRAFDAVTGKLVWAWDPGNPNVTREPLSPEGYTRGTPNVWVGMSYDQALGMVYLPTGNATPDFFGGERTPEDDKYSSSVVALNVNNGRPVWHFQTVHHDLWDFDATGTPLLYDIKNDDGSVTPALAESTKTGMTYLLDRRTGKPVAPIEERPVPQGNLPGERYSPTQPYSSMPGIGNETLTESAMWGATPFDQLMCRIRFKSSRYEGIFTPPGLDMAIQYPGSLGGINWGGVSVDPTTNLMFVNDLRLGLYYKMVAAKDIPPGQGTSEGMGWIVQKGLPFGSLRERLMSPLGVPCQAPPFGTMTAIDLKTRKIAWQIPVGTVQDTGPLGIPVGLQMPLGMPTLGPSLATRSGLLFFAGTQDFYLRAFNSHTGEEVWKSRLPVGSQSGPITYRSEKTGKQYVVIFAGGSPHSPQRGDNIIAYALPE